MQLVYLSPLPWHSFAQRPHHFVNWFHQRTGMPVLWVNPYPTRFPALADIRQLRASLAAPDYDVVTPSWLSVVRPGSLPIEPLPGSGLVNAFVWREALSAAARFLGGSGGILAIGKPSVLALQMLTRFPKCRSLYDAMDDFPAFYTGLSRRALARRERILASKVTTMWVSSSDLERQWRRVRSDVRLIRNGLDVAALPLVGSRSGGGTKAVFGYVGTIGHWFDWGWLRALALARAEDEIRLIGPVFVGPPVALPPNVKMLPACNHRAALIAMTEFDVGVIPFARSVLTSAVDPIKYYEYRALALPVISTDFGEMRMRRSEPGVFISRSVKDIAALTESSLKFRQDAADARVFAEGNAWEVRFNESGLLS